MRGGKSLKGLSLQWILQRYTTYMTTKKKHSILFVCLGNICRSPAAEGIMQRLVEEKGQESLFHIDSAGIGAWHVGQRPDPRMRSHGADHGYDFSSRARQICREDFDRFDLIVYMDEENKADLLRLSPTPEAKGKIVPMASFFTRHPGAKDVPDPYYGGPRGFDHVIELLEDGCLGLLDSLNAQ